MIVAKPNQRLEQNFNLNQYYTDNICMYYPEVIFMNGDNYDTFSIYICLTLDPNKYSLEEYRQWNDATILNNLSFDLSVYDEQMNPLKTLSSKATDYKISKNRKFIEFKIDKQFLRSTNKFEYSFKYQNINNMEVKANGKFDFTWVKQEENEYIINPCYYAQAFSEKNKMLQLPMVQQQLKFDYNPLYLNTYLSKLISITSTNNKYIYPKEIKNCTEIQSKFEIIKNKPSMNIFNPSIELKELSDKKCIKI